MVDFEFKSMVLVPSKRTGGGQGGFPAKATYICIACGHIAIFPSPTYDAYVPLRGYTNQGTCMQQPSYARYYYSFLFQNARLLWPVLVFFPLLHKLNLSTNFFLAEFVEKNTTT